MYIDGFGIALYRSFGDELQLIGPLRKVNLVIGQNNAGKSNILRLATDHLTSALSAAKSEGRFRLNDGDRHIGGSRAEAIFAYALQLDGPNFDRWKSQLPDNIQERLLSKVERVIRSDALTSGSNTAWFTYEPNQRGTLELSPHLVDRLAKAVHDLHLWNELLFGLTSQRGSSQLNAVIAQVVKQISPIHLPPPSVVLVPAIREVQTKPATPDFSGRGLIERLAKLQNPGHTEYDLKSKFEAINRFLRHVTGSESAYLEIPSERDTILIHLDNRVLPLASIGTGLHEVVILAAAATVTEKHLVCIEEPEIHLHPILQRKLLTYLQDNTDNQYLIATHSAHLLDCTDAAIFHVRLDAGHSIVTPATTTRDRSHICVDLGYRPSDLLQANCIIWVEGPSDRIYLRKWLAVLSPQLREGTHYSIMFYGGRLLSHLSADDPEVDEFISLRKLNRFISIMIDSDRARRGQKINDTKRRVKDEFEKGPGFSWITKGREIENYLPHNRLEEAILSTHKNARRVSDPGLYGEAPVFTDASGKIRPADKVKVARAAIFDHSDIDVFDLRPRLQRLIQFIEEANKL